MTNETSVVAQVPASTSNCGPGFDVLSIGLTLYNFIRLSRNDSGRIEPVGGRASDTAIVSMVTAAADAFSREASVGACGFSFEIWGEVPPARGLGSSAIIYAGTVAALNALHGEPLDRKRLVAIGSDLDGNPENVAASFFGGFCVSRTCPETRAYLDTVCVPVSGELCFVVISPEVRVLTTVAREALPDSFPMNDVVRSLNSLAYIVSVFSSGEYQKLTDAVTDFIHQPYRERLFPYVKEMIEAGRGAGAYTGWLSGSGSSTLCVAPPGKAREVGEAMSKVLRANRVDYRLFQLKADNDGLTVIGDDGRIPTISSRTDAI